MRARRVAVVLQANATISPGLNTKARKRTHPIVKRRALPTQPTAIFGSTARDRRIAGGEQM